MSIIKDTFFGGAEKKAAQAQTKALGQGQDFIREGVSQARGDINRLFPQAQNSANQGFQAALDVFGQSLPAQTDVFQQGNIGAQQAIINGLGQSQNALLGGNIDLGQLQQFQVQQPDLSFFNQTLPQIQQQREVEAQQAASLTPHQQGFGSNFFSGGEIVPAQFNSKNLLSGMFNRR